MPEGVARRLRLAQIFPIMRFLVSEGGYVAAVQAGMEFFGHPAGHAAHRWPPSTRSASPY